MKTGESYLNSHEKRALDLIGVAMLGPTFGAAALAALPGLKRDNGGIYFVQQRHGQAVRPDEPADCSVPKLKTLPGRPTNEISEGGCNHPDAKPFSSMIRAARLDEAPQLARVAKGAMSIVGPRAIVTKEVEAIRRELSPSEIQDWEWARRVARPGLAYLGAAAQYEPGYTNNPRRTAEQDILYAETASLETDLAIIDTIAYQLGAAGLRTIIGRLDSLNQPTRAAVKAAAEARCLAPNLFD